MSQRANKSIFKNIGLLVAISSLLPLSIAQADLSGSESFKDEDAVSSTTLITPDSEIVFGTAVNEDSTGDHVVFSSLDPLADEGFATDDPLELKMDFDTAIQSLSVSVVDADVSPLNVPVIGQPELVNPAEVVAKNTNVRTDKISYRTGLPYEWDVETQPKAFQVSAKSDATSSDDDVVLDFGSLEFYSLSFNYQSSDDAKANQEDTTNEISDLNPETVAVPAPEPATAVLLALLAPGLMLRRRRRSA